MTIKLGFANNTRAVPSSRSEPNSHTSRMSINWRMIFWGSSVLLFLHGIFQLKPTLTIPVSSFNDFELENRNIVVGNRDNRVNGSDKAAKRLKGNEDAVETLYKEIPNPNALTPVVKDFRKSLWPFFLLLCKIKRFWFAIRDQLI